MRLTLLILTIALLSACRGEKGKIILKGELSGLRQGELLVWNNDGMGSKKTDTIHIESGRFEYQAPATNETSSWTLVYPNMSTLTFFGRSKDVITLEGMANELRHVKVTGNEDNELYTALRLEKMTADSLISLHPTSAVARHVFQALYINNDKADHKTTARLYRILKEACPQDSALLSWEVWAQDKAPLAVGRRLPHFEIEDAQGDTISDSLFKGRRVLIGVWYSGEVRSREMLRAFRAEWRKDKDKKKKKGQLAMLTINVDLDPSTRATFERIDSIEWYRVNSASLFNHPLLRRWNIDTAPYIILADTAGIVRAMGDNFERDIKPNL